MSLSKHGTWNRLAESNKLVLSVLTLIILAELLLLLFFSLPLVLGTPVAFVVIESDSMLPEIRKGDIVMLRGVNDNEMNELINEVVAFYDPTRGQIIVHRAVDKDDGCLITKGDNAELQDFFHPCSNYILGRVIHRFRLP